MQIVVQKEFLTISKFDLFITSRTEQNFNCIWLHCNNWYFISSIWIGTFVYHIVIQRRLKPQDAGKWHLRGFFYETLVVITLWQRIDCKLIFSRNHLLRSLNEELSNLKQNDFPSVTADVLKLIWSVKKMGKISMLLRVPMPYKVPRRRKTHVTAKRGLIGDGMQYRALRGKSTPTITAYYRKLLACIMFLFLGVWEIHPP